MDLLSRAWGDKQGYVCISTKDPALPREESWRDKPFRWPEDAARIEEFISQEGASKDVYWSWQVYKSGKPTRGHRSVRSDDNILAPITVLGVDADYAPVMQFSVPCSVSWESSPHRYHGLWFMESGMDIAEARRLSKKLSYDNKCDKSGWDLSQVLRVPGTRNYKYGHGVRVGAAIMHEGSGRASAESIERAGSPVDALLRSPKVSRTIKKLHSTNMHDKMAEGRSGALWALESECRRVGLSKEETFVLAWTGANNKFMDRERGGDQIWKEIEKVWETPATPATGGEAATGLLVPGRPDLVLPPGYVRMEITTFSQLMQREYDSPHWLIQDIWMWGSHGTLAGEPKTYKSVISTDIAVSLATGSPFFGQYVVPVPGSVLIVQEENDPRIVRDRFNKVMYQRGLIPEVSIDEHGHVEVDFPTPLGVTCLNNRGFDLSNDLSRIDLELRIIELSPALVILDPLYMMLGSIDKNDSTAVRPVLQWLMQLRFKYGCAIMVLDHFRKSESARGGQRILGSTTFHGWAESGLYTRKRDNGIEIEREFRAATRGNLFATIHMEDIGQLGYEVHCTDASTDKEGTLIDLLEQAGEEGMSVDDLAFRSGIPATEIRKYINNLGCQIELVGKGKNRKVVLRT